ncbi:23S rRNA pseudouridine(2604) synthase RluF [Hymenobacter saemangeumensis]|uniref:Pseudouridine synthase n=1 Tax=Hymenobacter saemangeumensis TaxID=1084522 RepID=A0ABP8IK52_9BACT
MPASNATRLNKFISESGICSRREADRYIAEGSVLINGRPAQVGDQVRPGDRVSVNGRKLEPKKAEEDVYIAFNKPVGITSTTEPGVRGNIVDYVNHSARIFPIGRLDKDSSGLIFLTSNGDIVNKILRAGNNHEKEYVVTVDRPLTPQVLESMAAGVPMLGTVTKPCKVQQETPFIFRITLVQGLNRQIRRMCEHFGYEVTKLERVRIMNVSVKGLPVGDWRELTEAELAGLMKLVEKSSGTEDASGGKRAGSKPAGAAPRKPGTPPSIKNPSANGWWGPRPEKPREGGAPGKRPAKAGPGGPPRPKKSSAPNPDRPKRSGPTGASGRPADKGSKGAGGRGKAGSGRR